MRHFGLGLREVVAIALFAIALAVAFTFLDPAGGSTPDVRPPSQGDVVPTTAPTLLLPTAEPTPQPLAGEALDLWLVTFYRVRADGTQEERGTSQFDSLDLDFPASPTGDLIDDSWRLSANYAGSPLPEGGQLRFILEYDCEVLVYLNDVVVARGSDGSESQELEVVVPGGEAGALVIEARDVSGPFLLRVK